jgi:glycosyltransferase involved in cell wall biosynthesis
MTTLRDISRLWQFVSAIREQRPAVFHAHLTWQLACKYGILAANLAHVPAVVATQQLCPPLDDRYILRIQPRIIALGVDRYLAVSQGIARQLCQGFRIPQHQVQVVYNGIPLDSIDHGTRFGRRSQDSRCSKRPVVLTIARLVEQKGLGYLLEAAVHVPDATFLLAGDGPERANLEVLAWKLGIQGSGHFPGIPPRYRRLTSELGSDGIAVIA